MFLKPFRKCSVTNVTNGYVQVAHGISTATLGSGSQWNWKLFWCLDCRLHWERIFSVVFQTTRHLLDQLTRVGVSLHWERFFCVVFGGCFSSGCKNLAIWGSGLGPSKYIKTEHGFGGLPCTRNQKEDLERKAKDKQPSPPGLRTLRWDRLSVFSYTNITFNSLFQKTPILFHLAGASFGKKIPFFERCREKLLARSPPAPAVNVEIVD